MSWVRRRGSGDPAPPLCHPVTAGGRPRFHPDLRTAAEVVAADRRSRSRAAGGGGRPQLGIVADDGSIVAVRAPGAVVSADTMAEAKGWGVS